jgi:hypothetical protein
MCGVFPSFRFRVSVAASQKKPDFGTPKMEKALFVVQNENWPHGAPRHPNVHVRVRYGLVLTNYAMLMAESSSFNLKVTQPRT